MSLRRSRLRPRGSSAACRAPQGRPFPPCSVGGVLAFESPGLRFSKIMAEREGFEPSRRGLATYAISSRVPSASSDTSPRTGLFSKVLAEREGFEPSVRFYPYNRLAGGCLQPTRPPLRFLPCVVPCTPCLHADSARRRRHEAVATLCTRRLAEGVGFEPTEAFASAVFKTAALSHSAIPP